MEVVASVPEVKKSRKAAKKAVTWAEAIISALQDPAVKGSVEAMLERQAQVAAERSFAGQAGKAFSAVTDPRSLALLEVMMTLLKAQVNKKR